MRSLWVTVKYPCLIMVHNVNNKMKYKKMLCFHAKEFVKDMEKYKARMIFIF